MTVNGQHWFDRGASWWVKADRAGEHLISLREQMERFRDSKPVTLRPEPTSDPNRTAYRVRYHHEVPTAVSATIGDVLSNLRSALDNAAYGMCAASNNGTVPVGKENLPSFPIAKNAADFVQRFTGRFVGLWSDRAQKAFREVQPFRIIEMAEEVGVQWNTSYEDNFAWSDLHRLNALWNVDKHRRLAIARWWPDLFWWGTNAKESKRTAYRGDGSLADGSILLYIDGRDDDQADDEITCEFKLILTDDPAHILQKGATPDLVELLEQWHSHVAGTVFRQLFTIMAEP